MRQVDLKGEVTMTINQSHNSVAKLYEEIRPSYPAELIKDLMTLTSLKVESRLLEIGAGTGKATRLIAGDVKSIHCIEPGVDLAQILKEKCQEFRGIDVTTEPFEMWQPEKYEVYDMIYSAQAFHWIDSEIKYEKCHNLLESEGYLALFWYQPVSVTSKLNQALQTIINTYVSDCEQTQDSDQTTENMIDLRKQEIDKSGYFKTETVKQYKVKGTLTNEAYLKALNSQANIIDLETSVRMTLNERINACLCQFGVKSVPTELKYTLYIAKRL